MTAQHPLLSLLTEIEQALKQLQLWTNDTPSAEAMAYQEPFAIDTMSFENWLQFILLPRMQLLITQSQPLPASSQIAEMAEVVWAEHPAHLPLITLLRQFDQQLQQSSLKPTLH